MTRIAIFPHANRRGFGLGDARQARWFTAGEALARGVKKFAVATGTLVNAFAEARAADLAYRELSRMSDRELADMGLTRTDIPSVVAGVFTRTDQQPVAAASVEVGETASRPEMRKAA